MIEKEPKLAEIPHLKALMSFDQAALEMPSDDDGVNLDTFEQPKEENLVAKGRKRAKALSAASNSQTSSKAMSMDSDAVDLGAFNFRDVREDSQERK